jgi:hypothetical protein
LVAGNSTVGSVLVAPVTGNLQQNATFYNTANAITANTLTYTDKTATANIMGLSSNSTFLLTGVTNNFSNSTILYQLNANNVETANAYILSVQITGANNVLGLSNTKGVWQNNTIVRSRYTNSVITTSNGTLSKIDRTIGVFDTTNDFTDATGNYVYGGSSNTRAIITRISRGTLAGFEIGAIENTEDVELDTVFLYDYDTVELGAAEYGFPHLPTANGNTYIYNAIQLVTMNVGSVSRITALNPGVNYDATPFVMIYEPLVAPFVRRDYILTITNATGQFVEGEIVEQDVTGAQGIVKADSNTSVLYIKRIQFTNQWDTSNEITGAATGYTADVAAVEEDQTATEIGVNAMVEANVTTSNGSVNTLAIIDSGFGYANGEAVTFTSTDGTRAGTARVILETHGRGEGFYEDRNGFLSSTKKLFDGDYYQEFSYEIRTALTIDKYKDMLKQIMHVPGTKFFGALILESGNEMTLAVANSIITY